jgi:hypothetical protein
VSTIFPSRHDPTATDLTKSPHLCSNAGGGGERVLWTAIAHIQRTEPNIISVVYTGDVDVSKKQIISKAKVSFADARTYRDQGSNDNPSSVPVRYRTLPNFTALRIPQLEIPC